MESSRLIFEKHGNPADCLRIENFFPDELTEGEVLLKIEASPLNPADLNYIEGNYGIKPSLPAAAGMECCATVEKSLADGFPEGCRVMPVGKIGGWASHAVTKANHLIRLPESIDPLQAAMLKVNPATAWLLLHRFTRLAEGDWIALNAANSAVGQCLIQLASSLGINTVCFLRDAGKVPEIKTLGATHAFPDTEDGYVAARDILGKERTKLTFNAVGGGSAQRLMKLLEKGGTLVTYGAMAKRPLTIPNGALIFSDIRIRGFWVTRWMESASRNELEEIYGLLADRVTAGTIIQKVDSTFGLEEFKEALSRLESEMRDGKVLFKNCRRRFKTGFAACSKPDSLLEAVSP